MPGVSEELLFRSALLPHPSVDGKLTPRAFACRSIIPLSLFVAYHLVNPRPQSRAVFYDVRFLSLSAVLGASCCAAYYLTNGSLLAASVTHWLPVATWLLLFGGLDKLQHIEYQ